MDALYEIKVELERKNNNEWKKWNNSIGTITNNYSKIRLCIEKN
jgi:hypothetical protein